MTLTVGLPNVAQGLFRRRRKAVAAAVRLGVDGRAVGLLRSLRRRYAPGPLRARLGNDPALVVLSPRDVRRVLEQSPKVFASDPDAKRRGMVVAMQDTLAVNLFRALALLASHPAQRAQAEQQLERADPRSPEGVAGLDYLRACLEEAMRLWPTTAMLVRETLEETHWGGATLPAGTQGGHRQHLLPSRPRLPRLRRPLRRRAAVMRAGARCVPK